jgi:hypothetical protein
MALLVHLKNIFGDVATVRAPVSRTAAANYLVGAPVSLFMNESGAPDFVPGSAALMNMYKKN